MDLNCTPCKNKYLWFLNGVGRGYHLAAILIGEILPLKYS